MRALFVTSRTSDVDSLVRAWDCWQPGKSTRVMFSHMGEPRDEEILAVARKMSPDIIFYIGANEGSGIPTVKTFLALQKLAPLINLCCDAGDPPWHKPLKYYKAVGCFDLHVTLDGCRNAPVDLVTVTPVDPRPYARSMPRTVHCGFSGGVSSKERKIFRVSFPNRKVPKVVKARPINALPSWSPLYKRSGLTVEGDPEPNTVRDEAIWDLESTKGVITVRRRGEAAPYSEHAKFMLSCQVTINMSSSGSGVVHQIKGRVLEAGWAGCALLESVGSPIADWLPENSYFLYDDVSHVKRLLKTLTTEQIEESAAVLSQYVRANYHPRQIYGEILDLCGLSPVVLARKILDA